PSGQSFSVVRPGGAPEGSRGCEPPEPGGVLARAITSVVPGARKKPMRKKVAAAGRPKARPAAAGDYWPVAGGVAGACGTNWIGSRLLGFQWVFPNPDH